MTEEERKAAERLAEKEFLYDRPNDYGVYPERRAYVRGYVAACEAKRAEIERLRSALAFTTCCAKSGESHKIDEVVEAILMGKM